MVNRRVVARRDHFDEKNFAAGVRSNFAAVVGVETAFQRNLNNINSNLLS